MNSKNFILCMSYNPDDEEHQCSNFDGKCEDHKDCMYKNLNIGVGTYTWNNFRMELIKSLVDLMLNLDELDKEYENTLTFNFKTYKIKLKIEGG